MFLCFCRISVYYHVLLQFLNLQMHFNFQNSWEILNTKHAWKRKHSELSVVLSWVKYHLQISAKGIMVQNIIFQKSCRTRASAQRVTNTPGWHHFLIIKYFKVNDNDIRQVIVYNVSLWVTLIYHPKYNFPGVNSLQDMKQICWAIKCRSLTYIYLRN